MKRSVHLFLLIVVSGILVGCSGTAGSGDSSTGNLNAFIGGTSGLQIDFEDDSPPPEVTDDSSFLFNAIVRITNKGEATVTPDDIRIDLEGFLPSDFGVTQGVLQDQTIGRSETLEPMRRDPDGNVIDGYTTFVTIPNENSQPLAPTKFSGNVEFPFRANVCYNYKTLASARICVLKDLLNEQDDALCDPSSGRDVDSSGSPIQFKNFRQSVHGKDKISFTFDVGHDGSGDVFRYLPGNEPNCPDTARDVRANEDRVLVRVDAEGLDGLDCSFPQQNNEGEVRLINGKRSITCTLNLQNQHESDFEKIIDLTAWFTYEDSKTKTVLVKHLLE